MRIGTRITLSTIALVVSALVAYAFVSVRIRRAELRADLERQTQSVGNVVQVSLEAAVQEGLYEDVRKLVARIQQAERPQLEVAYVELVSPPPPAPEPPAATDAGTPDGGVVQVQQAPPAADEYDETRYEPPPPDALRDDRIRLIQIDAKPHGEHVQIFGRAVYAWTVPIRDEEGHVVAAVDLVRDEGDALSALAATQQAVGLTVVLLGIGLGFLVWLTMQRAISHPLKRLVEGIDEVSHGDLTRVILRERDDEVGDLAERFNQMTTNLRDAKAETERGVEARLSLEARLRHSEKLATIGQLAASIAHEVGTPLGVIGGRARTMEKKAADPQEVQKNASIIAAQASRITKIIQRLLDYARKKVTARARVDLTPVVEDSIDFLEHQLQASQVTVRGRGLADASGEGSRAAVVLGDGDELQQVCLNLLLNAMQSMPRGGTIEVGLREERRRKPGLDLAPPGRYVVLEVTDEGVGIAPEDRERIFEPFYSTKPAGAGTGLGLAVSLGIVKDHDGWIEIDAGPRGGSVFRVYLPAPEDDGEITGARPKVAEEAAAGNSGEPA